MTQAEMTAVSVPVLEGAEVDANFKVTLFFHCVCQAFYLPTLLPTFSPECMHCLPLQVLYRRSLSREAHVSIKPLPCIDLGHDWPMYKNVYDLKV